MCSTIVLCAAVMLGAFVVSHGAVWLLLKWRGRGDGQDAEANSATAVVGIEDRGDLPPAFAESTFRMLGPDEIHAAMAFSNGYIQPGTHSQRVKIGSAVTPSASEWLLDRIAESLG